MKLKRIDIKRFRSINDLKLEIDLDNNFISICGPNNVGKTNVLRALNLFFNPDEYVFNKDAPHLKQNTRGGSVATEINLQFEDSKGKLYELIRRIEMIEGEVSINNKGFLYPEGIGGGKPKKELTESNINDLIKNFVFFYIPAINISFPDLINLIINDVYAIEFDKSRFSGLKGELKSSFENYNNGLVGVLNQLAEEINPLFQQFNENWSVEFKSNAKVKKFQDLISEDISFHIDDKAGFNNEGKGSGLQKLGFILLHQKIIEKLSRTKKNIIFCIDEPDAFLHRGLQLKLRDVLHDISNKHQVIVTTHSPEFIDSSSLKNVILLDQEIGEEKLYKRTNTYINSINTISIDLSEDDGARKIREYLGLEEDKTDLLDNYNIFVEGECDKKYISELCKLFKIETKRIISIDGVNKYNRELEFYDNWYSDSTKKPKITLLFDNDEEGRKCYKLIKEKKFKNIQVDCKFIPTRTGDLPDLSNLQNVKSNLEIEDFIYPELIFHLSSLLLSRKNISKFSFKELDRKLKNKGFADDGILASMDLLLKDKNPDGIGSLSFCSTSMKGGLASHFNLSGNRKITDLLIDADKKYPEVRKFLIDIMKKN